MDLNIPWKSANWISFDTETSGAYPLQSEICEIAAVKWVDGKIVDRFQSLVRPSHPMSDFIVGIHGITNQMVTDAPRIYEVIPKFYEFIKGSFLMAHHAPFDLGFVAIEFERAQLRFPDEITICTSLLSRKVIPETKNHKLQTLVQFLGLDGGQAHRALDDAVSCLGVGLECFKRVGEEATIGALVEAQGKELNWEQFSIEFLRKTKEYGPLMEALLDGREVEIHWEGKRNQGWRRVRPVGLVRNPDGDYLMVDVPGENYHKKFALKRIHGSRRL